MTTTPPDAPPEPGPEHHAGPRATREEVRDLGRLRRSTTDHKIAGVAGGLARHIDIDPVILRVAFVVLVFFGGAGLLLYGALWLLVPQDDAAEAPFHLDDRNRTVALAVVGVVALLSMLGDSWGVFSFPWPLAVVALVALFLLDRSDRGKRRAAAAAHPGAAGPHSGPPVQPYAQQPDPRQAYAEPTQPYAGTYAQPYAQPTAPTYAAGPAAPFPPAAPPVAPPPNPRRRGPVLFWFTLALSALAIGVLGLVDQAGVPVADAAYSAVVVAVCGVMLVLGAFWGRPGGLVALGLVAALATATTVLTESLDAGRTTYRPATAEALASSYDSHTGELVVDLTGIEDLSGLDGRRLLLENGVGKIEVLVPTGLDVDTEAVVGIGDTRVLGQQRGGFGVENTYAYDAPGTDNPTLTLDAHLGIGQVEVHLAGETR